jgi:hypothetical protein
MHATAVLLVALSGLGCQNKDPVPIDAPAISSYSGGGDGYVYGNRAAPSSYSAYTSSLYGGYYPLEGPSGFGASLRDTFCSFFLGRSPDVPTPREIEASVYGDRMGY